MKRPLACAGFLYLVIQLLAAFLPPAAFGPLAAVFLAAVFPAWKLGGRFRTHAVLACTVTGAALLLRENADGETYETRIYLYEGALREEYGTADAALDPQDSERIVDAKSFSVEQVRLGLLVVSTEYGSADIALRSGRGAGPDA